MKRNLADAQSTNELAIVVAGKRRQVAAMKLVVIQDKEVNAGWVRANSRSTLLRVHATGLGLEQTQTIKHLLGGNTSSGGWANLEFSLRYADTTLPVTMLRRNQYQDKFELILPHAAITSGTPTTLSHFGVDTKEGIKMSQRNSRNQHAPWDVGMLNVGGCPMEVQADMRFSTNITSHMHGDRRFFWQATLKWKESAADVVHTLYATSHVFDYRPRPPPGYKNRPKLTELVSEGRAGDLLVCLGERIGDEFDDVTCELVNAMGVDCTLLREKAGKYAYNARLPEALPPGLYSVQMRVEGGECSNALHLEVFGYGSPPRLDATPAMPPAAGAAMEMDGEDFHDLDQEWDLLDAPSGLVQHGSMASMPLETPLDVSMLRQESFSSLLRSMSDSDTFLINREESDLSSWVATHEECIASGATMAQPVLAVPCV